MKRSTLHAEWRPPQDVPEEPSPPEVPPELPEQEPPTPEEVPPPPEETGKLETMPE